MEKCRRFDSGNMYGMYKTSEGYLRGIARVTRTGVFTYRNSDGTLRKELRHPDEVFKVDSMSSLKMIPMTNLHPSEKLVTADTAKILSIGSTGEVVMPDGKYLTVPVVINVAAGVSAVDNGREELSLGYECELDAAPGVYDGEQYDFVQRNIIYNHLAIVDSGRAGPDVRLNMDDNDGIEFTTNTLTVRSDNMVKLRLDNGLEYEAAPEIVVAFNQLKQAKNDADVAVAAAKSDADKARADADTAKEQLAEFKTKHNDAAIREKIKNRLSLEKIAQANLSAEVSKNLDSMSDSAIKKAVIIAKFPKANLDGKSDEYIQARFDAASEVDSSSSDEGNMSQQRQVTKADASVNNDGCSLESKRKAMMDRMSKEYMDAK